LALLTTQLSDIYRDPPRLIFGEQLGRRSSAWLALIEINASVV